ncbi:MAG: hypothetical protein KGQ37_00855 [Hyphomicrobiales bacterium]|nr:hypothetical protein [Hyphomicrobiales bacterium]
MLLVMTGLAAHAQMQLHPDTGPSHPAARARRPGLGAHRAQHAATSRFAGTSIAGLAGEELMRNGDEGMMRIIRIGKAKAAGNFAIAALSLPGIHISDPDKTCVVTLPLGQPLALHAIANDVGLERYGVDYPACPLQFDVLQRSVLVRGKPKACTFQKFDCVAHPRGLWGPDARSFGPAQAAADDSARGYAERRMRTLFVMLMHRTHGNRARDQLASDQAQFTTHRVMVCRNYARDAVEDFCALRLTEARIMALDAALVRAGAGHARAKMTQQRKNR